MVLEPGFEPDESHVEPAGGIHRLHNDEHGEYKGSKRNKHHQDTAIRHPAEHMATMARAAQASNEKLAKKGLPYRFCVCEKNGRIIIDLVLLDQSGKIVREIQRDITNEDFDRLIDDVASIEGLLIDKNG